MRVMAGVAVLGRRRMLPKVGTTQFGVAVVAGAVDAVTRQ